MTEALERGAPYLIDEDFTRPNVSGDRRYPRQAGLKHMVPSTWIGSDVRGLVAETYPLAREHYSLPIPREVEEKVWEQRNIVSNHIQRRSKTLIRMRSWIGCQRSLPSIAGTACRFNRYDERCRGVG